MALIRSAPSPTTCFWATFCCKMCQMAKISLDKSVQYGIIQKLCNSEPNMGV